MTLELLPVGAAGADPAARPGVDPRVRILAVLIFALSTVSLDGFVPLAFALAAALTAALLSGLAFATVLRRLVALEGFMVVLLALLPFTVPGRPLVEAGPLAMSAEGLALALAIALKANAVVLAVLSQLGTLEPVRLGRGLAGLGVSAKLVVLLLLTVRYIAVFQDEYRRLRRAMRARGFRTTSSRHAWRSLGWLVGMLLVRSNDRGQRVLQAMKCRGFTGRFPLLDDLGFRRADGLYLAGAVVLSAALVAGEGL